jgi:hypothetical protein
LARFKIFRVENLAPEFSNLKKRAKKIPVENSRQNFLFENSHQKFSSRKIGAEVYPPPPKIETFGKNLCNSDHTTPTLAQKSYD